MATYGLGLQLPKVAGRHHRSTQGDIDFGRSPPSKSIGSEHRYQHSRLERFMVHSTLIPPQCQRRLRNNLSQLWCSSFSLQKSPDLTRDLVRTQCRLLDLVPVNGSATGILRFSSQLMTYSSAKDLQKEQMFLQRVCSNPLCRFRFFVGFGFGIGNLQQNRKTVGLEASLVWVSSVLAVSTLHRHRGLGYEKTEGYDLISIT